MTYRLTGSKKIHKQDEDMENHGADQEGKPRVKQLNGNDGRNDELSSSLSEATFKELTVSYCNSNLLLLEKPLASHCPLATVLTLAAFARRSSGFVSVET